MNNAPRNIYEVSLVLCGMNCKMHIQAAHELRALSVTRSYLAESGLPEHQMNAAMGSAKAKRVMVLHDAMEAHMRRTWEDYFKQAQSSVTVDYDEQAGNFVVRCNGEPIDWFATRKEAEAFANTYDNIQPQGIVHEKETACA